MTHTPITLFTLLATALGVSGVEPQLYTLHSFKKIQVSDEFWCEGVSYGDFNHDGKLDISGGPFWWEGPDFKVRHEFRPATKTSKGKRADGTEFTFAGYSGAKGNINDYSDNFLTYVYDFNGDGWADSDR